LVLSKLLANDFGKETVKWSYYGLRIDLLPTTFITTQR